MKITVICTIVCNVVNFSGWRGATDLSRMAPVTMHVRKYIVNKLLDRKQFIVDLSHPGAKAPSRDEIKDLVAKQCSASNERVVIFGLHTKFGGGRTTGFGFVYDSKDAMMKVEPSHRLVKAGLSEKSKSTRRMRKNTRKQKMKVWGSGARSQKHKVRRQQRKEELGV